MRALAPIAVSLALSLPFSAAAQGAAWSAQLVGPHAIAELRSPQPETRVGAARVLAQRGEPRRAVSALLEALEAEEDARVRAALFDALARRGDAAAVPALASGLADWARDDRAAALRTLGAIGGEPAMRVLVEWLGTSDVGEDAVRALVRVGAPAVPHLLRALAVPAAAPRAAHALGEIGDARATPVLVGRLQGALPAARIAMIAALAAIGDERATRAVARFLSDPSPAVVAASLDALGTLGAPSVAAEIEALAERGPSEQRARALRALVTADPLLAAPVLTRALSPDAAPLLRTAAIASLLEHPSAPLTGVLGSLLDDPAHGQAAAEALSRVPDGHAVPLLLARAMSSGDRVFDAALALAVRRHESSLDSDLVHDARAHLASDPSPRGAVLAALAHDEAILPRLEAGLRAEEPRERAWAALGLQLLGATAPAVRRSLVEALGREREETAFRALALAALFVGAPVAPARIDARWWDAGTAPEVLWLTAANLDRAHERTRSRARRAMRRGLRAPQPRVRAGAAVALAMAGERSAWRPLVAALEDDHDTVRLAAARALATLAVEESVPAIAARERVERDRRVAEMLRTAAVAPAGRSWPPLDRGQDVLFARVVAAPGIEAPGLAVDVLLSDGRWLRAPTLVGGEVLVPDLASGEAEVQIGIDR